MQPLQLGIYILGGKDSQLHQNVKQESIDSNGEKEDNSEASTESRRANQRTSDISQNDTHTHLSSKTALERVIHLEEKTGLKHDSSVLIIRRIELWR